MAGKRDYYEVLEVARRRRGRDQAGVPTAGHAVPPRPQPRGQGGGRQVPRVRRGVRGAARPGKAGPLRPLRPRRAGRRESAALRGRRLGHGPVRRSAGWIVRRGRWGASERRPGRRPRPASGRRAGPRRGGPRRHEDDSLAARGDLQRLRRQRGAGRVPAPRRAGAAAAAAPSSRARVSSAFSRPAPAAAVAAPSSPTPATSATARAASR